MSWAACAERGGDRLTRAALWLVLRGGRIGSTLLIWPATLWFLATATAARGASRDYLRRALGRQASLADVATHFHAFAHGVLDRVFLLSGRDNEFDIQVDGLDDVLAVISRKRGCILLGAHLGSFEVLRAVARRAPVPVWALMYRRNGGALTAILDRLAPDLRARIIEIGDTASMIQARECIERGEVVGILADRTPPGHKTVSVPFLGARAAFPVGPFVLASTLGAPVVMFSAVRSGPRVYQVRFEPMLDRVVLRRESRAADLRAVVARYAAAVEALCRAQPYQWFNFFPFWEHAPDADPAPAARRAARPAHADLVAGAGD